MTLFWITAFIVLTAAEALTVSLTCIWFAGERLRAFGSGSGRQREAAAGFVCSRFLCAAPSGAASGGRNP